jgi:cell division septal protein FtsQ
MVQKKIYKKNIKTKKRLGNNIFSFMRIFSILIIICTGAYFFEKKTEELLKKSRFFTIKTVLIEGCFRVDKNEVLMKSKIASGLPIIDLKPALIEKELKQIQWVRDVKIIRNFPSNIKIKIEEREPIALINYGKVWYTDKEGVLLPMFKATYSNLPLVSGIKLDSTGRVDKQDIERLKKFLKECKNSNVVLARHISQLDLSDKNLIKIKLEDYPTIIELSDNNTEMLLQRLQRIISLNSEEDLQKEKIPKKIDLCYENLAFVRW